MQINLPWPSRKLSPNGRCHWAEKAKEFKKAKQVAFWLTKEARVRPEPGPVLMTWIFHPKTRNFPDVDNLVASCKAYADGIAEAWSVDDRLFKPTYVMGSPLPGGQITVIVG